MLASASPMEHVPCGGRPGARCRRRILCPGRPLTKAKLSKNVPAQAARLIPTSDPARANSTLLPERVLGPALGGPENKIEYGVGGFADCQERRWAFGQRPGKANQLAHVNAHVLLRASELIKQGERTSCVAAHAFRLFFPYLDARGGQLDERLQECGGRTVAAAGEPQFLPGLVRFPVEAMVKEVYAAQVGAGGLPISCVDRLWPFTRNAMAMAARVAMRMRKATRHVGIRRERVGGQEARLRFGLRHTFRPWWR